MNEDQGDWRGLITVDPRILRGKPVINGTRIPVRIVVGSLAAGMSVEEVCEEYCLTPPQVCAALSYAAEVLADEQVYALAD